MKATEWKTADQIANAVADVAQQINATYKGKEIVMIGVLNGAIVFMTDLMKQVHLDMQVDFIRTSSYGNSQKSRGVKFTKLWEIDLTNKHVILVDDIFDTGATMKAIMDKIYQKCEPASVSTCTLVKRISSTPGPNFWVLDAEKEDWIYGYGLDQAQYYRNLPSIHRVDKDE